MIPLAPESCPKRFFISELFFKPDGAPVSTAWEAATIIVRPETGLRIRPNRIFLPVRASMLNTIFHISS